MKHTPIAPDMNGTALDRRGFLTGVSVTLAGLPLQTVAAAPDPKANGPFPYAPPQRAVYQGLAYLDHDGVGEAWDKPAGNQATRDYVNSISQETFLRRHWFT